MAPENIQTDEHFNFVRFGEVQIGSYNLSFFGANWIPQTIKTMKIKTRHYETIAYFPAFCIRLPAFRARMSATLES